MTGGKTSLANPCGYVLFEVILALTIFAIAVVGLATNLNDIIESSAAMNLDNSARIGLRSFIEEVRRKPVADMNTTVTDSRLGATYTSTVETLSLKNNDGAALNDLYTLHARVAYGQGNTAREETVDLYVYKPAAAASGK